MQVANALTHWVWQVLGDRRLCGDFVGLVMPVHAHRGVRELDDVKNFFAGWLDLLSDRCRCYLLICRLHQSYASSLVEASQWLIF